MSQTHASKIVINLHHKKQKWKLKTYQGIPACDIMCNIREITQIQNFTCLDNDGDVMVISSYLPNNIDIFVHDLSEKISASINNNQFLCLSEITSKLRSKYEVNELLEKLLIYKTINIHDIEDFIQKYKSICFQMSLIVEQLYNIKIPLFISKIITDFNHCLCELRSHPNTNGNINKQLQIAHMAKKAVIDQNDIPPKHIYDGTSTKSICFQKLSNGQVSGCWWSFKYNGSNIINNNNNTSPDAFFVPFITSVTPINNPSSGIETTATFNSFME
eukprot:521854_1